MANQKKKKWEREHVALLANNILHAINKLALQMELNDANLLCQRAEIFKDSSQPSYFRRGYCHIQSTKHGEGIIKQ